MSDVVGFGGPLRVAQRRGWVVAATVALSLALSSGTSPAAEPGDGDNGVATYAAQNGIPLQEAYVWIDRQGQAGPMHAEVRAALGSDFGGYWFDRGRFKVGVAHGATAAAVRDVATRRGLSEFVDVVPVRFGHEELAAGKQALLAQVAALRQSHAVASTWLDVPNNAVYVYAADDLSPVEEATLQLGIAAAKVRVTVGRFPRRSVTATYHADPPRTATKRKKAKAKNKRREARSRRATSR